MKKQRIFTGLVLSALAFVLILAGCEKKTTDSGSPAKIVLSKWSGEFTGMVVDGTANITLYTDKTLTGNWSADDGSISLNYSGTYTQVDTVFTFSAAGTASYQNYSSNFTLTGSGIQNTTTMNGAYSIDFVNNAYFNDQNGNYHLTKVN